MTDAAELTKVGRVGVVVGNPKPASRTRSLATAVAEAVASATGLSGPGDEVVDLADLGPRLFDPTDPTVKAAVERTARWRAVVVASPTYKGAYTGLLKAFLDWFSTSSLVGVTVVPVMLGAGPRHALAVDVHLRPVLIEIGASLPTRGLFVLEEELDQLERVVADWMAQAAPLLRSSLGARPRTG